MAETQTAPILVDLSFERSTKGTHVYSSAGPAAAIATIYIKKTAFVEEVTTANAGV